MSGSSSPKVSIARRSRQGCLECRQRRKKCDELKPTCSGCRERELPCTYPNTKDVKTQRKPVALQAQIVALPRSPAANINRLVEYFHTGLTTLISFPRPQKLNPFSSLILPFTSQSQLVCTAVESVASAHLSILGSESANNAQNLHAKSLQMLATRIASNDQTGIMVEQMLAVSLLLIYYEIILGNSIQASRCHLEGAYALLKTFPTILSAESVSFFTKIFRYFDVMLALSSETSPLGFRFLFPEQTTTETPYAVDYIFGLTSPLWPAMETFARLISQNQLEQDVVEEAERLERHLHSIAIAVESENDPTTMHNTDLEAMRQIAVAYKNSALLTLYKRFLLPHDARYWPQFQNAYTSALDALLRICLLSGPMSTMTWPLYTVASCAESRSDRIALQGMFDKVFHRQQANVLQGARDAVQQKWQQDRISEPQDPRRLLLG